jgi:serine/threonine-protein kinase
MHHDHGASERAATHSRPSEMRRVGRCLLVGELAQGGMATIHLGRWTGGGGFSRVVAVKALHRQFSADPDFRAMLLDEARLVARIRHPNVVPIVDLIEERGELFILMEHVESVTLGYLCSEARRRRQRIPPGVTKRILVGILHGLHAAHHATDEKGRSLAVIHRDVSPDNVLVGSDGHARLIDFGIARALGRSGATREGWIKGKPSYLAPEQVTSDPLSQRSDVWGASVVLWEALTGKRLFRASTPAELVLAILEQPIAPPSSLVPGLPRALDAIVLKGLSRRAEERWPSAEAMAEAIEAAGGLASHRMVGEWVRLVAHARLQATRELVAAVERVQIDERGEPVEATPRTSVIDIVAEPSEPGRTELTSQADAHLRSAEPRSLWTMVGGLALAATLVALGAVGAWQMRGERAAAVDRLPLLPVEVPAQAAPVAEPAPPLVSAAPVAVSAAPAASSAAPKTPPPGRRWRPPARAGQLPSDI